MVESAYEGRDPQTPDLRSKTDRNPRQKRDHGLAYRRPARDANGCTVSIPAQLLQEASGTNVAHRNDTDLVPNSAKTPGCIAQGDTAEERQIKMSRMLRHDGVHYRPLAGVYPRL